MARTGSTRTAPDRPTKLPRSAWSGVLKRTIREFREDNVTDWAAALTYYGVLAIFPAMIAVLSVIGLFGASATQPLIQNAGSFAPGPAKSILVSALQDLQANRGSAGVLFIVSL